MQIILAYPSSDFDTENNVNIWFIRVWFQFCLIVLIDFMSTFMKINRISAMVFREIKNRTQPTPKTSAKQKEPKTNDLK